MENNKLNLINLLIKILISTEIVYHLMDKNSIFNRLVEEYSYQFQNLKRKINHNNLIYKHKTERRSPKDLSDLKMPYIQLQIYGIVL